MEQGNNLLYFNDRDKLSQKVEWNKGTKKLQHQSGNIGPQGVRKVYMESTRLSKKLSNRVSKKEMKHMELCSKYFY